MSPPADRLLRLREIGLSEYAARAYLALLELGTTEARDVSRLSKVPLAKVYNTLDQLQERGLAIVEPGPPKRFTPAPFAAFLQRRKERLVVEMRELDARQKEFEELFPLRGTVSVDDRGAFFMLRGRESVVEKFSALMRAAQEDVLILTADHFTARGHVATLFAEAAQRGVKLRALVRVADDTVVPLAKLAATAELRAKDCSPGCPSDVAIAVFDSRQLMIIHFVPDDGSRFEGKDVAIVAGEGAMVRAVRSMLGPLWLAAEPFEHAAARMQSGLPRTATSIFDDRARLREDWIAAVGAAKRGLDLLSTLPASALMGPVLDTLSAAAARGVRVRVIARHDDAAAAARLRDALGPRGEIRDAPPGALQRMSILDGTDVYFGPTRRDQQHVRGEELTIRTNDPGAVRALCEYFDEVWEAAGRR